MRNKVSSESYIYKILVIEAILELGNDVLKNIGVEERIDDVAVFFRYLNLPSLIQNSDMFYIQFF